MNKVDTIFNTATLLVDKHLPGKGWKISLNNQKTCMGFCDERTREISLSIPFIKANSLEESKDTVLHEIAHAIAGNDAMHGPKWRAVARRIGVKDIAANAKGAKPVPGKWKLKCTTCNEIVIDNRHRRSNMSRKAHCGERNELIWIAK